MPVLTHYFEFLVAGGDKVVETHLPQVEDYTGTLFTSRHGTAIRYFHRATMEVFIFGRRHIQRQLHAAYPY